jgi:hypothetical protein
MTEQQFDVFLAHSSKDKPLIRQIYQKLTAQGIRPWLDEEEIAPGTKFQDEIQQAIGRIKTTAIFLGQGGLGPWQALELKSFISQCVRRGILVIPVLLPGVEEIPEDLIFLQEFQDVRFRDGMDDENALFSLQWGITRQKPTRQSTQPQTDPVGWAPPTTPPVAPPPEDNLSSEKGIDYRKLRNLLKAGQWKEADKETGRCMIEAIGRNETDYLRPEELLNFPCTDLLTVDALWVRYSNGKWGFSVQKRIYVECGANLDGEYPGNKIFDEFCRRVGWHNGNSYVNYSDLTFDLNNSSAGELPGILVLFIFVGWRLGWVGGWGSLLSNRDL